VRKPPIAPMVVVLILTALGASACATAKTATGTTPQALKAAFCAADKRLDKASAGVTSDAGFLRVLKANPSALQAIGDDAPAGKVGRQARALAKAAEAAVASNSATRLHDPSLDSAGADVDTYCRVDGTGNPLPHDFAKGRGTAFCVVSNAINTGTQAATNEAAILAFLAANQTLINQYAFYVPHLPSPARAAAQALVTAARAAIAANSPTSLETRTVSRASTAVKLFCGENQ
jgi:hypothetical protein